MNILLEKLSERSTYTALAAILLAAGVEIPTGYVQTAAFLGAAIAGVAGVVLKEGWKKALSSGDAVTAIETAVTPVAAPTPRRRANIMGILSNIEQSFESAESWFVTELKKFASLAAKNGTAITETVLSDVSLVAKAVATVAPGLTASGVGHNVVSDIETLAAQIGTAAASVEQAVVVNAAQPFVTQISNDLTAINTALAGFTLPATIEEVLKAAVTMLPYIQAGVGIITAGAVEGSNTGLDVDQARLILAAAK